MMKCIYCSELVIGNNKSKEHVIPQWLIRKLGIKNLPLSFAGITRNYEVTKPITPVPHTFVHKVCSTCNNGWLSNIDNSCYESLSELIHFDKKSDLSTLSQQSIHSIYIFIYKIFLNFYATSPENFKIDKLIHYRNFYESKLPIDGTEFFLSFIPADKNFYITHLDYWMALENRQDGITELDFPQNRIFSFKFYLQLGNIAFVLCNSGSYEKPVVYDPSILYPLVIKYSTLSQIMQKVDLPQPIWNTTANMILSNALRIKLKDSP